MNRRKGINVRIGAIALAIALLLQISAPATVFATGDLKNDVEVKSENSNFVMDMASYTTRVKWGYSDPKAVLEFGFKKEIDEVIVFTQEDSDKLIATGKIQVNNGDIFTFEQAGITVDNWGYQYFKTNKPEFMKTFINDDELNFKIIEDNGNEIPFTINNSLSEEQRQEYMDYLGESEVDKSKLSAKIDEAKALKEADYTADSFAALIEKLTSAESVFNKEDATQSEVDTAYNELGQAINGLVKAENEEGSIVIDEKFTVLKNQWGTPKFDIALKSSSGEGTNTVPAIPTDEEAKFVKETKIEINGKDYETMEAVGFFGKGWPGANTFRLEGIEDLKNIKEVIHDDSLNVKLTLKSGEVVSFVVANELPQDMREEIGGKPNTTVNKDELKAEIEKAEKIDTSNYTEDSVNVLNEKLAAAKSVNEKADATQEEVNNAKTDLTNAINALVKNVEAGDFNEAKVRLVKSSDHSKPSMAGAVLKEDAEILTSKDGKHKLILHFQNAEVMGRLSYTTDLKLGTSKETVGDIPVDFVLKGDNSSVAIIDIPEVTSPIVYEGWINSNQMDSEVALEISNVNKVSDNKTKLDELIAKANQDLSENQYYPKTKKALEDAISDAQSSENYVESYANVVKMMAKLREIKENPFEGDTVFHVQVSDPSYVGGKLIQKWARVTINDKGETVLKINYDMNDKTWEGRLAFTDVQVFDKDGNKIDSTYTRDQDDNGTLEFVMPYIPESGIFKAKHTELDGRTGDGDIQLDYSTIKKGAYRDLILFAIEKYNKYTKEDWVSQGDLEELKDEFTENSWKNYSDALKACKDALETPGISQEKIDEVIENLKVAKQNLLYKAKAGKGNDFNLGVSGINNPNNYYSASLDEKPRRVGWAGSKVIFGKDNHIFKVLNDGNVIDENGDVQKTNKMLIMAEDLLVKKPFADKEIENTDDAVRWKDSVIRAFLNGEFYQNNFTDGEKELILDTTVKTRDMQEGLFEITPVGDEITTEDKVFLPSIPDFKNPLYGFASSDGRDTTFGYASRNIIFDSLGGVVVGAVKPKGRLGGYFRLNSKNLQALPAMSIDKSNVLMTIKADMEIPTTLTKPVKTDNNTWRMIVVDSAKKLEVKSVSSNVSVNYNATNSDGDDLIAMVVRDGDYKNGKLVSIAKVGKVDGNSKVDFELKDFDEKTDKLYLFTATNSKGTSFASEPVEVSVDVNDAEVLKQAKEAKKAEIDKVELTDAEKEGMSADSIKKAEAKLEELKEKSKAEVDSKTTVDEVNAVELPNKAEAIKLLEKEGLVNGKYTVDTTILQETQDKPSMSDQLFIEKADVKIKGDDAEFSMYVVYPIPGFPDQGKDGTLKDFVVSYKGKEYKAKTDITTKPMKPAKQTSPLFGLKEGEKVTTQVIKFTLPQEALKEEILNAGAFVNAVMMTNVNFRIKLENLELVEADKKPFEYEANVDNGSDVKVEIENDPIESLKIVISNSEITMDDIAFLKDYDDKTFSIYSINLFSDGKVIKEREGTSFVITLPLTNEQAKAENLEIFHLNGDNTKKESVSIIERTENSVSFRANSFSPYLIVSKTNDDENSNGDDDSNNGGGTDTNEGNGSNNGDGTDTNEGNGSNNGDGTDTNEGNGSNNGDGNDPKDEGETDTKEDNKDKVSDSNNKNDNNNSEKGKDLPKTGTASSNLALVSFILFALAGVILVKSKRKNIA